MIKAILVAFLAASSVRAQSATVTVLVLETKAVGADAATARETTRAITQALTDRGVRFVTEGELAEAAELASARQSLTCEEDAECLARIAELSKAAGVVTSTLGIIGSAQTLTIALHEGVSVKGRVSRVLDEPGQLDEVVRGALAELFSWQGAATRQKFVLSTAEKVSFAVLPLAATGVSEEVALNLTEILAVELKRIEGANVVALKDVLEMLSVAEQKSALTCSTDTSCLAEIGGALGVDKLVAGQVGKLGEKLVVGVRLIDREKVLVDNRVTETFVGPEEQLIRAVRQAVRDLVGIKPDKGGALVVTANEPGTQIFVDGEERGRFPGPPIEDLTPGRHTVRVARAGFFDWQRDLYVDPDETTTQWVELVERPRLVRPFLPQWGFWTLAGASALTAIGAGASWVAGASAVADLDEVQSGSRGAVVAAGTIPELRQTRDNWQLATWALAATGLKGAIATGAAIPMTHWDEEEVSP